MKHYNKVFTKVFSLACAFVGLTLVSTMKANAYFRYCDWPTGLDIVVSSNRCYIDGTCFTRETPQGGACATNANPCTYCSTFTFFPGIIEREGICSATGDCAHNPSAPGTTVGPATVTGCTTGSHC